MVNMMTNQLKRINHQTPMGYSHPTSRKKSYPKMESYRTSTATRLNSFVYIFKCISLIIAIEQLTILVNHRIVPRSWGPVMLVAGHVVLTRDDNGGSLVLTGEDGKGEGGDQLVIAGNQMGNNGGGGQSSNMIMQDAENREGDIVMNGKSMIIPGEDGHIVLADSRNQNENQGEGGRLPRQPPNPFMLWAPYMNNRYLYRMMPFFGR